MTTSNRRFVWPGLIALVVVLVGAAYAMGRKNNPLRPGVAAAATVDSMQLAQALNKRCGKLGDQAKTDCYSKPLDSLAALGEVRFAMGTLNQIEALDVDAKRDGHVYAHGIGIVAGKRGGDLAKTFSMCDESNQSGCYHGVIQAYFDAAKKIGPTEVNTMCKPFQEANADRWLRFQCVHGMGHGLTMVYSHDLPKALTGCDFLNEDWDRQSCYGGAFMENIVNVTNPHHPAHGMAEHADHSEMDMAGMNHDHEMKTEFKAMDPKDPQYPCSIMAPRYLMSCYQMQTSVMLHLNKGDIGDAAKSCDKAPGVMKYVCYTSLGRDISSYSLQDHATAIKMCSLGTEKYQPWCYVGLVKNLVDLNARADDGFALCKKLSGEANKVKCYEAVGEQIGTLRNDSESRTALCEKSEPAFFDVCLFGARVSSTIPASLKRLNAEAFGAS